MESAGHAAGQKLGRYRILEEIGAGGMGVVYRARDEDLDREVAVKVMSPGAVADEAARKRFRKEALALSRLNHPNIETVYELATTPDGTDYLAMELVAGQSLEDKLAAGQLAEKEIVRLGTHLAEGLVAAHGEGVVHRDLKPGNLRLTSDGRLKILDFGLARLVGPAAASAVTQTMAETLTGGTLPYMAPEQLRGEDPDPRSDLYATGAVLYEMATGQRPFPEVQNAVLVDSILNRAPTPPIRLNPRLSAGLENVILKCLEKEPERRYQSAKELLVDLRRLETPSSAAIPPAPAARRLRAAAPLVVLAALALAWLMLRHWKQTTPPSPTPSTAAPAGHKPSTVPEANEYLEKALLFLKTQYDLPRARQMLEHALTLDPHFAEARAWYGFTDILMVDSGYSNDTAWLYRGEQELRRALQDDPNSARAHAGLAGAYLLQGRKVLAPAEVEKALAANPDELDALVWQVNYHHLNGEYAEAERVLQQMLDKDPLFFPGRMLLGDLLRDKGNLDEAIRAYGKILEVDRSNTYATWKLARVHLDAGRLDEARRVLKGGRQEDRSGYDVRLTWAQLLALEGKKKEALAEMNADLLRYAEASVWNTVSVAEFYAVLGQTDTALAWLERAVRSGDERAAWFNRDPLLANIRDHPRFRQIVESITYSRQKAAAPRTASP